MLHATRQVWRPLVTNRTVAQQDRRLIFSRPRRSDLMHRLLVLLQSKKRLFIFEVSGPPEKWHRQQEAPSRYAGLTSNRANPGRLARKASRIPGRTPEIFTCLACWCFAEPNTLCMLVVGQFGWSQCVIVEAHFRIQGPLISRPTCHLLFHLSFFAATEYSFDPTAKQSFHWPSTYRQWRTIS